MILREGLGFGRLSLQEQQAYRIMLRAFSTFATSFNSSQIDKSVDLMKVVRMLLGDNPSIIHFNKTHIKVVVSMFGQQIQLTGYPKSQVARMNSELEMSANAIVASVRASANDEYSQLLKVYEFLQTNVKYDKQELMDSSKGKSKNPYSHNAYGALVNGLAVCDGFSSGFALLTQMLGFDCTLVSGCSTYRSAGSVEHAWNIIKVRNKCYHMDSTWDANQYNEFGVYSYDYFGLDDEEIASDHDWDIKMTPACSHNDLSFYTKNGFFANNLDQLYGIIRSSVRNRHELVRIKISYNIVLPIDAGEYLAKLVVDEAAKSSVYVQINYYWNEHTRCFFSKFVI